MKTSQRAKKRGRQSSRSQQRRRSPASRHGRSWAGQDESWRREYPIPRPVERVANALARVWSLPLAAHVAALAVLVVSLAPFLRIDGVAWVDDEGYYGLQVQTLADGSWEYDYRAEAFDPDAQLVGLFRADRGLEPSELFPYIKHPGYIVAMRTAVDVFGEYWGFHVLSMVGLLGAAAAAWLLARNIDPRASRPAFWLVVVSALLVNAYIVWAHTVGAALAGMALVSAVSIVNRGVNPWNALGLGTTLAAGALARTENVLFAVVLTVGIFAILGWRRRVKDAVLAMSIGGVATLAAVLLEVRWIERITGASPGLPGSRAGSEQTLVDLLHNRLVAFGRLVFDAGDVRSSLETNVYLALGIVALAGLALRMSRSRESLIVGTGVLACASVAFFFVYGSRFNWDPFNSVTGFVTAWPVILLAFTATPWYSTMVIERWVVGVSAAFALGVFATQYDEGGSEAWGGRFLTPIVVPLAVIAAVGLGRRLANRPRLQRWAAASAIATVALYPVSAGLGAVHRARLTFEPVIEEVVAAPAPVTLISAETLGPQVPTFGWRHDHDVVWMASGGADIRSALALLASNGVRDVAVLVTADQDLSTSGFSSQEDVTGPSIRTRGWKLVHLRA